MIIPKSFYNQNTLKVAQDLLGCFLVKGDVRYKITETEAYMGPEDKASHASRGMTPRNEVMFGPAGIIYVYLIYGMYSMLNIVTEADGYPAAVLIRGIEEVSPSTRRPSARLRTPRSGLAGPGKLTKALGIDKGFNKLPIYTKKHGLWIESRASDDFKIIRAKRVGVDYAGEWKEKEWRFMAGARN